MSVLVLSASMQPLNVISSRRLVVLLDKERVTFLSDASETEARDAVRDRRLPDGVLVVRLLRNLHMPRRRLRPNRRNLLLRDEHTCQYCGLVAGASELTIDHILPISRGGPPDRWENVVIACKRCNWRKADRRPDEAGLHLRRPARPLMQEYSFILFMRHPELKAAYEAVLAA